jgi:hypothetical protein
LLTLPLLADAAIGHGHGHGHGYGTEPDADVQVGKIATYLYDPSGAVIRAQLLGALARKLSAHTIASSIAYLSGDTLVDTPFASAFRVIESLPLDIRTIAQHCRETDIGTLEIKKRGVDIDPATYRTKLKQNGSKSATLFLTRAGDGRKAIIAERIR